MLSSEASAEPGRWHTDRAPYAREVLDAIGDPLLEEVVLMWASQTSKTEMILNALGQTAHDDPCPMMVVQPTIDMAQAFSKDRVAPMIRDTPALTRLFGDPTSRNSNNTLLHKSFTGGHLTMAGANSPASLASRPIRKLFLDEVDRFPLSAGSEGDPVTLAKRRTATFPLRKIVLTSTPTLKGESRIEEAFLESDQRYFHVHCPECGEFQRLEWKNLRYKETTEPVYECAHCANLAPETQKHAMLLGGNWVAYNPDAVKRGYHLNALYSVWYTWPEIVEEWHQSQGNPLRLQAFVNTILAETYADYGERVNSDDLATRREQYEAPMPPGAVVLTAGIDVQADRIEVFIYGWGKDEESWLVAHEIVAGDVSTPELWDALDEHIWQEYATVDGEPITVSSVGIDSGHYTESVLRWGIPRLRRGVYILKGGNERGKPLVSRKPTVSGKGAGRVWMVGTDTSKDLLYGRLRIVEKGPGFIHLPEWVPDDVLGQLTAEVKKPVKEKGAWTRRWELPRGHRREAADGYRYALAALALRNYTPARLAKMAATGKVAPGAWRPATLTQSPEVSESDEIPESVEAVTPSPSRSPQRPRRRGGLSGGVHGWK